MKKDFFQEIEIPEGLEVNIEGNTIIAKGKEGENKREFSLNKINLGKKDNKIIIGAKMASKNQKRMINTNTAHINNLLKGVNEKFEYKLKIVYSHFPITVDIQAKGAIIKNFLGEKIPRKLKILEGVDVKIENGIITVSSYDKELAGQTAANFEKATRIRMKDRRVFQDGIFILNKAGKEI